LTDGFDNIVLSTEKISSIDKSSMLEKILEFPDQILKGWRIGENAEFSFDPDRINTIVLGGMGGSAVVGDFLQSIFMDRIAIPIFVNRSYTIPDFVSSETLFIASSYSGNTEETIASTEEAVRKGASIICVTSGGKIGSLAESRDYPIFILPGGYPPRAALGYTLGVLLNFFYRAGLSHITLQRIQDSISFINKLKKPWSDPADSENMPLTVARQISGRLPVINSSIEKGMAVAVRWKTQLNENSKTHAFLNFFPEMNHNEIVGWERMESTSRFFNALIMILLRMSEDSNRVKLRMDITKSLVEESGGRVVDIAARGNTYLDRLLYLIFLGDLVSFYLAIIYGKDPTEIKKIDSLKKRMAENY